MPPKKRGGKKGRKGKKHNGPTRELEFKEEGEEYAQITKMLGNGCVQCYCFDGKKRMGVICGKMRNRVWISPNDIVLVSRRPFNDQKCDIVLKYYPQESKQLKALGELPYTLETENNKKEDTGGMEIRFDAGSEEEESEEDEIQEETPYINDLPPTSSDEEYWEKQELEKKKKEQQKKENLKRIAEGKKLDEEEIKKQSKQPQRKYKEAAKPGQRKKFDVADSDDDSESADSLDDVSPNRNSPRSNHPPTLI